MLFSGDDTFPYTIYLLIFYALTRWWQILLGHYKILLTKLLVNYFMLSPGFPIYLLVIVYPYQALVHGLANALPLREDLREVPRAQHVPAQFFTFLKVDIVTRKKVGRETSNRWAILWVRGDPCALQRSWTWHGWKHIKRSHFASRLCPVLYNPKQGGMQM